MCDLTARYIGTPVALTLPTRTIIAKSHDYSERLVEEYITGPEFCTLEELRVEDECVNAVLFERRAVIHSFPYVRYKWLLCGCFCRSSMVAVLNCPITGKKPSDDAFDAVELAASVVVAAMQINSYISPNTVYPMQVYLIGLLRGDVDDQHQQLKVYNSALEKVSQWHLVWAEPGSEEQMVQARAVIDAFCAQRENMWCAEYAGGIVILMDAHRRSDLDKLAEACGQYCRLGVSESYTHLSHTAEQLSNAQAVLRLARFEDVEDSIVFVQKYKYPILILSILQSDGLGVFQTSTLDQIKLYDAEHSTEYFHTLRAYLLCSMDYGRIAKRLHVHKNTVSYRMQRIAELFDLDLKDCRVITHLYLSLFSELLERKER